MWQCMLTCAPCLPSLRIRAPSCDASTDGPQKYQIAQETTLNIVSKPCSIFDLSLSLRQSIIEHLPGIAQACLGATSQSFRVQGLSSHWPFLWRGGETVVTGEFGWLVQFGEFGQMQSQLSRLWWALELSELNGLLAIGLSDMRMPDNIFIGAPSKGKWMSWGWEVTKRGALEAVDALREEVKPRSIKIDLRPSLTRTVVFVLLLDLRHATLELYAKICCATSGNRLCFLDQIPLSGLGGCVENISKLRPTACVDIGACVRLIDEAELTNASPLNKMKS